MKKLMVSNIVIGIFLIFISFFYTGTVLAGQEFFVSPSGSASGNGSRESPWDLQTALNQPTLVHPGDTIWLRGGTYTGNFISHLTGTETAPITVKQYPGEKAILAASTGQFIFRTSAPWGIYEGFEIMSNNTNRTIVRPDGVQVYYQNNKFINLVVHDANNGFTVSSGANNSEIYGSIIFNNGYQGEVMGKGHGLLLKTRINDNNENRFYRDNIIFNQYGWGPLAYAWGEGMEGHYFEGNTIFNNNILAGDSSADCFAGKCVQNFSIGGGQISKRITLKNNYIYGGTDGTQKGLILNFGWWQESNGKGGTGLTMENNVVWCNADCYDMLLWKWDDVSLKNNLFAKDMAFQEINGLGNFAFHQLNVANFSISNFSQPEKLEQLQPDKFSGNKFRLSANEPNKIFIRPNLYEPGRANVTIYNWENRSQINLDLSSVLQSGDQFEIIDVQNYGAGIPLFSGTFNGSPVNVTLPTSSSPVSAPVGGFSPRHTPNQFSVFLVRRLSSGASTSPTPTNNPACICQTNNGCSPDCTFEKIINVNYLDPIKCSFTPSLYTVSPDFSNRNNWCNYRKKTRGDANGDGIVNNFDYYYYIASVFGGKIPPNINPDFNGDGEVGRFDLDIFLKQTSNL